jgi:hypothetical protein
VVGAPSGGPHTVASQVTDSGCDTETGAYDTIQVRQWAEDSTYTRPGTFTTIVLTDEQRWRADDGSGHIIITRSPPGQTTPPATGPPHRVPYVAGELAGAVAAPLATEPAPLTEQMFTIHPRRLGATAILRAVDAIYSWHCPRRAVRSAILHVLADTAGLTVEPGVTDRAGRTGTAVHHTRDGTTDTLILDPTTGMLLAYEQTRVKQPTPPVDSVLYLKHGRHAVPGANHWRRTAHRQSRGTTSASGVTTILC